MKRSERDLQAARNCERLGMLDVRAGKQLRSRKNSGKRLLSHFRNERTTVAFSGYIFNILEFFHLKYVVIIQLLSRLAVINRIHLS
jgi:hypothetical protein